jgi:hypothetical protein
LGLFPILNGAMVVYRAPVTWLPTPDPENAMNPEEMPNDDELFQLEWKIAQRADALARQAGADAKHALDCWQQAEREIWNVFAPATPLPDHAPLSIEPAREVAAYAH